MFVTMGLEHKVMNEEILNMLKLYAGMRKDYANDPRRYTVDDLAFKYVNKLKGPEGFRRMEYLKKYYEFVRT